MSDFVRYKFDLQNLYNGDKMLRYNKGFSVFCMTQNQDLWRPCMHVHGMKRVKFELYRLERS